MLITGLPKRNILGHPAIIDEIGLELAFSALFLVCTFSAENLHAQDSTCEEIHSPALVRARVVEVCMVVFTLNPNLFAEASINETSVLREVGVLFQYHYEKARGLLNDATPS